MEYDTGNRGGCVKISFVVPVFNAEQYLETCVNSILEQSYPNIEVILVNDGSTDNSLDICCSFQREDDRVIVIDRVNGGVNSARKEGAEASCGDYIVCVDADDWIETDMLDRLLGLEPRADVYAFCYYEEGDGFRRLKKNIAGEGLYRSAEDREYLYSRMLMDENVFDQGIFSSLCNKMIRRDIFIKNQMMVPDQIYYGEDTACTFPCLLDAETVWLTNMPLYHYRLRQDSCVRSAEITGANFQKLYGYMKNRFSGSIYEDQLNRQLRLYMWQAVLLKAYGRIDSPMVLFPYEKVRSGMRIAIYGAGLFGQAVAGFCEKSSDVEVTGWFDRQYEAYIQQGFHVMSGEDVVNTEFDIMVIAILNLDIVKAVREDFVMRGIGEHKIDHISAEVLKRLELPQFCTIDK